MDTKGWNFVSLNPVRSLHKLVLRRLWCILSNRLCVCPFYRDIPKLAFFKNCVNESIDCIANKHLASDCHKCVLYENHFKKHVAICFHLKKRQIKSCSNKILLNIFEPKLSYQCIKGILKNIILPPPLPTKLSERFTDYT